MGERQQDLIEHVASAAAAATPLQIRGGGSKHWYGRLTQGELLDVTVHNGIIDYTPAELVISARAGTSLDELEAALEAEGQMLPFEPPHFAATDTLGGTVACGLSGPRRPYCGAARDFVLGINCINGKGDYLRFGGRVMKNVAGYDLSRTLTGSFGTLAVLLDIHLKVLPRPEHELTLCLHCTAAEAIGHCNRWAGQPLPLSGACHYDGRLLIRLSGTGRGVTAAARQLGGERLDDSDSFWRQLRDQKLDIFGNHANLWRVCVPAATAPLALDGDWLIDWGGAQRWLDSTVPATDIRRVTAAAGGHATLWRSAQPAEDIFQPLPAALLALHQRLKHSFDPAGILNPGRMYRAL